ncbi:MAG: phosphoribosylformylglycinamidine synthase subunit PurQ [Synergistaceae bacterium]
MRTAIVVFPGSNCDRDVKRAIEETLQTPVEMIWHEETDFNNNPDLIVLPGGFSYGDYLRSGAMAARSPIMSAVKKHSEDGGLLLGICNGFQVLTEAHLLPGALLTNTSLSFICHEGNLRIESTNNAFTSEYKVGDLVQFPIAHHEGLYFSNETELKELEENAQVVFRYADPQTGDAGAKYAPNGALNGIAGISNKQGNILGLMPHPERATIPHLNGGTDGIAFWKSIFTAFNKQRGEF